MAKAKQPKPQSVALTIAATLVYGLRDYAPRLTRAERRKIANIIEELPAGILPDSFKVARAKARKGK